MVRIVGSYGHMYTFDTQRPVRQRVAGSNDDCGLVNVKANLRKPSWTSVGASPRNAEWHDPRRFVGNHEKRWRGCSRLVQA